MSENVSGGSNGDVVLKKVDRPNIFWMTASSEKLKTSQLELDKLVESLTEDKF